MPFTHCVYIKFASHTFSISLHIRSNRIDFSQFYFRNLPLNLFCERNNTDIAIFKLYYWKLRLIFLFRMLFESKTKYTLLLHQDFFLSVKCHSELRTQYRREVCAIHKAQQNVEFVNAVAVFSS